jgi:hypothetical protein
MERLRRFAVASTLLVIVVALYPAIGAAAKTRANHQRVGSQAPVGTVTADKPKSVDLRHLHNVKSPSLPQRAFINRPTMPLARYLAAKLNTGTGRRPGSVPTAPRTGAQAATNLGGFDGITQATAQDTWPPDINGAVGLKQVVEIVNQHLTVFNKSTHAVLSDRSLATITGYTTRAIFDPRVLYDPTWKRWVATAEARSESTSVQNQFVLVSKTSNAAGAYFVYGFNVLGLCGSSTTNPFWDYPQLGMNQDGLVVTANCFQGVTFVGSRVFGVAKALTYNGLAFSVPVFSVATADSTTTPSQVFDQNPNMDMLTRNGPHQITFGDPANGFYTTGLTDNLTTGFFTPSVPRAAGQAGCTTTSCLLDTSDGRFVAPGVEFGNELWNVASYGLSGTGTFATPTWGEFNTSTHATIQRGTVFADGCSDDFNASIAVANDNRAWLNWTSTDPQGSVCGQTFVRQEIATRLSGDTLGTFPSRINPFTSAAELTGNFDSNFGLQRWGDTSSFSRDPSSASIAWSWNESVPNSSNWGTRAQKIQNS